MPLDPRISLAVTPPQFTVQQQTPLELQTGLLSLQNLMQAQQLGGIDIEKQQLALEQARLAAERQKAVLNFFANPNQPPAATGAPPANLGTLFPPTATPPAPAPAAPIVALPAQPATAPGLPTGGPLGTEGILQPVLPNINVPPVSTAPAPPAAIPSVAALPPPAALPPTPAPAPTRPVSPAVTPGAGPASAPFVPTPAAPGQWNFGGYDLRRLIQIDPIGGPAMAENFLKSSEQALKTQHEQWQAQRDKNARMSGYAQSIIPGDESSKLAAIANALNNKDITPEQARQLNDVPSTSPIWQSMIKGSLDADKFLTNQIAESDLAIRQAAETRNALKFIPEYRKLLSDTETAGIDLRTKQRMDDGSVLAPQIAAAEQIKDPTQRQAAIDAALGILPPERRAFFLGVQSADDVRKRLLNPEQYFTQERANLQLLNEVEKTRIDRQKNDAIYGPGTIDSLVQQVYEHPDSAKDVKPEVMGTVIQRFRQKFGIPFPTPLSDQMKTQENAAITTGADVEWLREALKDKEISDNLGPLMGNLQNREQPLGLAVGIKNVQKAQEFRTRMRDMVINQAKELGARINPKMIETLQKDSGQVQMSPEMLNGALDAVEADVKNRLDRFEETRFGPGNQRPPEIRFPSKAVPTEVRQVMSTFKADGNAHHLQDKSTGKDYGWWKVNPDGSIQRTTEPAAPK